MIQTHIEHSYSNSLIYNTLVTVFMVFKVLNYFMILVFALAASVQYNDEDPLFWILIYSAACVASVLYSFQKVNQTWLIGIAAISAIWALLIVPDLTMHGFQHMFGDIKMMQSGVKEAREFLGLLLVCGWMVTLGVLTKKDD